MGYQIFGLILFLVGYSHTIKAINRFEPKIVLALQKKLTQEPIRNFFKEIWFFGRTSFALIVLFFLICINWKTGLVASGVFLALVVIEQQVKILFKRVRPFADHQDITMLQPLEPSDPSFPSGDALRVWYLALIIPAAAGSHILFLAASIGLAILVTLGRMIMGVHYLTDTLSGAGLGILGAGTTIWLWTLLILL
jgi:membrane-associated phospholipid phosphatase